MSNFYSSLITFDKTAELSGQCSPAGGRYTPLFSPEGSLIGGWVVGFKLHWITAYLRDLNKPEGTFIFIVERKTGVLISASDPHVPVLKDYTTSAGMQDVILATECPDRRVSEIAKKLLDMAGGAPEDPGT